MDPDGPKDIETVGEVIYSDRVTHVVKKGPDHPLPFAKGTHDNVEQGKVYDSTIVAMETTETSDSSVEDNYGRRTFNPLDVSDELFQPYEEFSGAKKGLVYRMGGKGLGYYTDRYVPV